MRIFVLQLARFGDVFQTWPTLQALRRVHPGCELHLLVRSRFRSAVEGLADVIVHDFPTPQILQPIFEREDTDAALDTLIQALQPLKDLHFDQIINLSFSPMSSYLTDWLTEENTSVRGYTRHSDGYLHIPDDTSAYFYAQVGVGRSNRYHLTELFAAVAGVDLCPADFPQATSDPRQGIAVHLGASTEEKSYPGELWLKVLRQLDQASKETIHLIGAKEEEALSATLVRELASSKLRNWVGQTTWAQTHQLVQTVRLLIGADSAPIHLASLYDTPTLNLSSSGLRAAVSYGARHCLISIPRSSWPRPAQCSRVGLLYMHRPFASLVCNLINCLAMRIPSVGD
jgi:heptosyltransferase-3